MKDIYALSPETDEYDSPRSDNMIMGQGLFGADNVLDLQSLRPLISQVSFYW
jgi:hypothetical protein